ncbi:MAG: nucleotide sugar dehydrogenase [Acidobacteriota bacterium]
MTDYESVLLARIEATRAGIGVIGLGYVGLPLAVAFGERGFPVVGIDVDENRVDLLNSGRSYIPDVESSRLQALGQDPPGRVASVDYAALAGCDAVLICVPTPLGKTRDPDVSFVIEATERIVPQLHPGMLICLESTTYPGTTEELVRPVLEQSGLRIGEELFLAFSPERIDPGSDYPVARTPKVVGGATPACLRVAVALYQKTIEQVVPVSSTQAAEMVKLLENTFRAVNIALVNEVAIMCDKLGLDVWEVVEAAATKPYGFMRFDPGPGVGGHCIPLDPHYLAWKLKTLNYNARFIQLAGEINTEMPRYWVDKVQDALNEAGKPLKGSRVLILGVAYKKDVDDVRESPALDILELLQAKGADTRYHDPHLTSVSRNGRQLTCEPDLEKALTEADCVLVVTDHSTYDWPSIASQAVLLVDTRHVCVREGRTANSLP